MPNKFFMLDGEKSISLTGNEGWTFFTNLPKTTQDEQYARVAAVFAAYNLIADTIGNMPFVLYQGEEEYDTSAKWANKIGFLPRPEELLRLVTLSLIATNTAYNLRTSDVLGYKTKGLYHAVAYSFSPVTDPRTGELVEITRKVGNQVEHYKPDDRQLIRMWRMDHTTEVLPSRNTMAQAVMANAGQVYFADMWISHFYARGGIAPTVLAMKGLVTKDKKEDEEKSWTDWLKGFGKYTHRIARIFNADAMEIKQLGSSIADLKNNEVYRSALEGIAIGMRMPLSLLLANSANYATASQEYATWINTFINPLCKWIASEYNDQVFAELGLRLEFKPETLDPEQEDETQRAAAASAFMDFMAKCETLNIFLGACEVYGFELTDKMVAAATDFYSEKKQRAEDMRKQMQPSTTPPVPQDNNQPPPPQGQPQPNPSKRWIPDPDELEELRVYRELALRTLKRGERITFEYRPHYGGLPEPIMAKLSEQLAASTTKDEVITVFKAITQQPEEDVMQPDHKALLTLAASLDRLAEAELTKPAAKAEPQPMVQVLPNDNTNAIIEALRLMLAGGIQVNVPEQPTPIVNVEAVAPDVIVNVPEQPAPIVNVTVPKAPPPVVNVDVPPSPKPVEVEFVRGRDGKIQSARAK